MKKKKTGGRVLAAIMFCALLCNNVTGCGNAKYYSMDTVSNGSDENTDADYGIQYNAEADAGAVEEKEVSAENAAGTSATGDSETETADIVQSDRNKIIKRYYYNYETEKFDDAYAYLREQIKKYQGYISSSELEGADYRTLTLTARIPAENSDAFTGSMGNLGTVISQSESAEDVTLQYTDTESRIASLKTEQERLNELIKKADDLESIITLEERLTEVRYELENYQSRKNLYDDLITYSTVNITLSEVSYTVEVDDSTFISRISTGLEKSFRDIKNGFVNFLAAFIILLPYLVVWAVILLIILWIIRRFIRRVKDRKKRKAGQKVNPVIQEDINIKQEDSNTKKE